MPKSCTICAHPKRNAIDTAIVEGASLRSTAQRFGTSAQTLIRHKAHVPAALAVAHEAEQVASADDTLGRLRDCLARALGILDRAERSDPRTALAAIREARGCLELLAKMSGELQDRHRIEMAASHPAPQEFSPSDVVDELTRALHATVRAQLPKKERERFMAALDDTRRRLACDTTPTTDDGATALPEPESEYEPEYEPPDEADADAAAELYARTEESPPAASRPRQPLSRSVVRAGSQVPEPDPERAPEPDPERQRLHRTYDRIEVPVHFLFRRS